MAMRPFLSSSVRPGTVVDSMYSLPLSGLGKEEIEDEKTKLTLQPKSTFGPCVSSFCVYRIDSERLYVPREYGIQRFGKAETDQRVEGDQVKFTFGTALRPVQTRALSALDRHLPVDGPGGAIVVLPCGMGKTVLAIAFAASRGRKTAVLVHTTVLKTQWQQGFEQFCPGVRVGFVQGNTFDVEDKDVVIMMLQTVAKRQFEFSSTDQFGLLVCDEAHHLAAPTLNQALRCFRSRHVLALTATKERPDGLTHLLHWSLGPEAFRAERESQKVSVEVVHYKGAAVERNTKDGRPLVALMLNHLASHSRRNQYIVQRVLRLHAEGRVIIVLSHRTAQLASIRTSLLTSVSDDKVGILQAQVKDSSTRLMHISRPILLCTYNMADEGLDKKQLDTCVMATPKSRVEQCIGRIQRECDTKQSPLVIDVVDDVTYFQRLAMSRQTFYRKQGYETTHCAVVH